MGPTSSDKINLLAGPMALPSRATSTQIDTKYKQSVGE
jgi:hypothetical protein